MNNCPKCGMPRCDDVAVGWTGTESGPKFGCGSIYRLSQKRFTVETTACCQIAALRAELELARRVADAAVAGHIVWNAYSRIRAIIPVDYAAKAELLMAMEKTRSAMNEAVREYRASVEAAAFMAQPGVRRGLEGVGEMEEG